MKLQLPPEPLTRGLLAPDTCPLSSSEFVEPPSPSNKIPGFATGCNCSFCLEIVNAVIV